MPSPVFVAESGGPHIYKVGRVGLDSGSQDDGGVYVGTLRTERSSPVGEDGLAHFRRVAVRVYHTGYFNMLAKVYVDGKQTQVYATKQYVADPVYLDQWTLLGSPVLIGGQADPRGGQAAYWLEDTSAGSAPRIETPLTITANAPYQVVFRTKRAVPPPSPSVSDVRLTDTTAPVERLIASITWVGNEPTVAVTVGAGLFIRKRELTDDWWEIVVQSETLDNTHAHSLRVTPATPTASHLGSIYLYGFNVFEQSDGLFYGTQIASTGLVDQVVYVGRAAPMSGTLESIVEFDVNAVGTYIETELTVDSDRVSGVFLPESVEYHFRPVRPAKSRSAVAT